MPQRNPVEKRVDWIEARYPPTVVLGVVSAWGEANAVHSIPEMLRGLQWSAMRGSGPARAPLQPDAVRGFLTQKLRTRPHLRSTPFDRHLPWLANALNEKHKDALKRIRNFGRLLVRRWGPDPVTPLGRHEARVGRRLQEATDVGGAVSLLGSPSGRLTGASGGEIREVLYSYQHAEGDAVRAFGTISRWAAAESVDLGKYDLEYAAELAEDWRGQQKWKDGGPQGLVRGEWPDGWRVVELITVEDLDYEGAMMGHCSGQYDLRAVGPTAPWRLFSLRDPKNEPHATMEWDAHNGHVSQLRGKGNQPPLPKYLARMVEFRRAAAPYLGAPPGVRKLPDAPGRVYARYEGTYGVPFMREGPRPHYEAYEIWDGFPFKQRTVEADLFALLEEGQEEGAHYRTIEDVLADNYAGPNDRHAADDFPRHAEWALYELGVELGSASDEMVQDLVRLSMTDAKVPTTKGLELKR